jgi:hypothetical protein
LEKTASIRLEWKPPHGTWRVLDATHVDTRPASRVFVLETALPADDRSLGYERGSSVSREWLAAVTEAAAATAVEVIDRLPLLAGVSADAEDRRERLQEFVVRFASVAFRRPLTAEEEQFLREFPFAEADNPDAAVRRAIVLVLQSPYFLYTDLTPAGEPPTQYAIAARLALALWDSIPDAQLMDAAANGQLATAEQVAEQARRMLSDPRAREKMRSFFDHWLEIDEREVAKDQEKFPEFDAEVLTDLRTSLELFLERVMWSETSDYRELLLADYLLLNERLRPLYAAQADESEEGQESGEAETLTAASPADVPTAASFQRTLLSRRYRSKCTPAPVC